VCALVRRKKAASLRDFIWPAQTSRRRRPLKEHPARTQLGWWPPARAYRARASRIVGAPIAAGRYCAARGALIGIVRPARLVLGSGRPARAPSCVRSPRSSARKLARAAQFGRHLSPPRSSRFLSRGPDNAPPQGALGAHPARLVRPPPRASAQTNPYSVERPPPL